MGLGSGISLLLQAQFSRDGGVDPVALAGVAGCREVHLFDGQVVDGLPRGES